MAGLFGRDKSVISRHIKNIFSERELSPKSVVANFATTAADGKTYQNALVALALLIAESRPSQKDILIRLVMHFLAGRFGEK